MVAKLSAGILLYRGAGEALEVLLVHPGGPFWAKKDLGAWSVPKGGHEEGDDPLACALREFEEELGSPLPADHATLFDLGSIRYKSGKTVRAWAASGELDTSRVHSNTFKVEWPPRSGVEREFPEVDRAEWFSPEEARKRVLEAQVPFIDRLLEALSG